MKKIYLLIPIFSILLLFGCDKMDDIKEAVSGIDTQAEKAKNAITVDAHTIRAIEIEYNGTTFTINDLFKTILRDVQWEYEKKDNRHILIVKGTWQEPLFEDVNFSNEQKEELMNKGKVYIQLTFENEKMIENQTTVSMSLNDEILFKEEGKEILYYLYDIYLNKK